MFLRTKRQNISCIWWKTISAVRYRFVIVEYKVKSHRLPCYDATGFPLAQWSLARLTPPVQVMFKKSGCHSDLHGSSCHSRCSRDFNMTSLLCYPSCLATSGLIGFVKNYIDFNAKSVCIQLSLNKKRDRWPDVSFASHLVVKLEIIWKLLTI